MAFVGTYADMFNNIPYYLSHSVGTNVLYITYTFYILPIQSIFFLVKILLFVTSKSDQDPDPEGSAWVWLPGSGSGLALR
jgi:hypothetical protein